MKKHTRVSRPFLLLLLFLFSLSGHSFAQSNENPRILVLNSYHPGFLWSDGIMEGIKEILYGKLKYPEITFEYMDTKRHFDGLQSELIMHYLDVYRLKYEKDYFDVIIVSDDNAFQFMLLYGDSLFSDTPVVFCGVNNYNSSLLSGRENYTGVVEKADDRSTIRLMLQLHPNVKKIGFVTDWTTSGRGNRRRLKKIAEEMSDKAEFFFLDPGGGLTAEELKQKAATLGPDTAIFYRDFFQDKNGTYLPPEAFMPELTSVADVPVYSIGSFYLGLGIVGGKMDSAREHGDIAARLAADILKGTPPKKIPVIDKAITKYMFDHKVLKRFDVQRRRLPPNSIIINRPFTFYYEYTEVFWTSAGVLVLLLSFTSIFYVMQAKRKLANKKLEATLNSIGDAVITADRAGNVTSVNPVAERLLGLPQREMIGRPLGRFYHISSSEEAEAGGRSAPFNPALEAVRRGKIISLGPNTILRPPKNRPVPVTDSAAPIRDHRNAIIGAIIVFRDKTEEYLFQKSIEESLQEKTVLLQEIHHRVKNNLNIVISLLNLQTDEIGDVRDPKAVLLNCRNRVFSMALVHEHLYKYESLAAISMKTYIEEMASNLYELYGRGTQITYSIDADPISLHIDTAVPAGLILNELITNAFNHAFPGNREGEIAVSFKYGKENSCIMTIADNGTGFPEKKDDKRSSSLGLELVEILAQQLNGRLTRSGSSGTTYTLTIPLTQ